MIYSVSYMTSGNDKIRMNDVEIYFVSWSSLSGLKMDVKEVLLFEGL
jgi:hypothetical protein